MVICKKVVSKGCKGVRRIGLSVCNMTHVSCNLSVHLIYIYIFHTFLLMFTLETHINISIMFILGLFVITSSMSQCVNTFNPYKPGI